MKNRGATIPTASLCFATVISILALTGCTQRFVDYTLLSTKNVDLSKAGTFKRGPNRVTGEDKQMIIIIFPTSGTPHLKEAVDRAIESVPGAVGLVDGVVRARSWWFIVGESAIIVEGTPLIDPSLPGASAFSDAQCIVSFYNPDTRRQEAKAVNQATFRKVKESARRNDTTNIAQTLTQLR